MSHDEKTCISCNDAAVQRSDKDRDLIPVPAVPDDVNSRLAAAAPIDTQTGERMTHLGNRGPMSKDMKEALAELVTSDATPPKPTCGWCKCNPIGDCAICQARPSTQETYADDRSAEAPFNRAPCGRCDHLWESHAGALGCAARRPDSNECCTCPGYMAPEQRSADDQTSAVETPGAGGRDTARSGVDSSRGKKEGAAADAPPTDVARRWFAGLLERRASELDGCQAWREARDISKELRRLANELRGGHDRERDRSPAEEATVVAEFHFCPMCGLPWAGGTHKAFCFGPPRTP